MLVPILLFIVGLVLLIKGGDWFVDAATGIAQRFHVPELLIGATVVSIGTTLPEVMVSATSAVTGHGEIAYGNALGSIICNTALIAALTAAIRPSKIDTKTLKVPVIFYFVALGLYMVSAYVLGYFSRPVGIILLAVFVVYMVILVKQALGSKDENSSEASDKETAEAAGEAGNSLVKDIVMLVIGAAFIAVGADLLVDNGTLIAAGLGVPESVIALTFVALGTSLPELVTAITSLAKGHGALSLGNVCGANLFNLVLVSGLSVTLAPFSLPASKVINLAGNAVNASLVIDLPLCALVMGILTLPALFKGELKRWQGVSLLIMYAAFCIFQFV